MATSDRELQLKADKKGLGAKVRWPAVAAAVVTAGWYVGTAVWSDNKATKARIGAVEASTQTRNTIDDMKYAEIMRQFGYVDTRFDRLERKMDQVIMSPKVVSSVKP